MVGKLRRFRTLPPSLRKREGSTLSGHSPSSLDHLIDLCKRYRWHAMPSAFAVRRLTIISIFVVCWTGRSAGISPLSIRPS